MTQILFLLVVTAVLYALYTHYAKKDECHYCGARWGGHEAHCPWNW